MKTKVTFISALCILCISLQAQKLTTRTGYIRFFSEAPVENIEAINEQVSSIVDLNTGNIAFLVPIKSFNFEKALMQEHFNENYMESGKYPKASFQGKIADYEKLDLSENGSYPITVEGKMNIHGTEKEIKRQATFIVNGGKINLKTEFKLRPEDYDIKIPASKRDNIAETLEITVNMDYDKP